jgi:hypothetical protein
LRVIAEAASRKEAQRLCHEAGEVLVSAARFGSREARQDTAARTVSVKL